jgi:hypothetical protein
MREQRHLARANKARAEAPENRGILNPPTGELARESARRQSDSAVQEDRRAQQLRGEIQSILAGGDQVEEEERRRQSEFEAINAYMREQRHQRLANKARAENPDEKVDIDACIAQAERAFAVRGEEKRATHRGGIRVSVSDSGRFVGVTDSVARGFG